MSAKKRTIDAFFGPPKPKVLDAAENTGKRPRSSPGLDPGKQVRGGGVSENGDPEGESVRQPPSLPCSYPVFGVRRPNGSPKTSCKRAQTTSIQWYRRGTIRYLPFASYKLPSRQGVTLPLCPPPGLLNPTLLYTIVNPSCFSYGSCVVYYEDSRNQEDDTKGKEDQGQFNEHANFLCIVPFSGQHKNHHVQPPSCLPLSNRGPAGRIGGGVGTPPAIRKPWARHR